jgi:hypothetical protein
MRIALALGLHPIVFTTRGVSRPPGDSTRERYRARLNDHVRTIVVRQLHNPLTCVGGCHGPIGA